MNPAPGAKIPWHPALLALVLAAVTFAVFWPALQCDFLNYDDRDYFAENPLVQNGLTAAGVRQAFTTTPIGNWDPLVWLSFMGDVECFGPGPRGPHSTNVLLHSINAALLFLWLNFITGARWRCLLVAVLFAWHPLRVESVAWIAERKDVLSGCFSLLTLIAYARFALPREPATPTGSFLASRCYWLAVICFLFALMSKATVITLPFVLLLVDYWPLNRVNAESTRISLRRLVLEKIPFLIPAVAVGTASFLVHHKANALASFSDSSLFARVGNAFVSYACYLGKMFFPVNLALPYPRVPHWPVHLVVLSLALIVGGTIAAVRLRKALPHLFTGWFWFVGMLVPVIGLVQWGDQSMADRFTYLPAIGFWLMIVWTLADFARDWPLPKLALRGTVAVVLLVLIFLTRAQLGYWQNSGTLFKHAIEVTDGNYVAYSNLGLYEAEQGRLPEAAQMFAHALEINPRHAISLNNLGNVLFRQRQVDDARDCIMRALELDPNYTAAHFNLGQIYLAQNKAPEAIAEFEATLRLKPDHRGAHKNIALALLRTGRQAEAIDHLRIAAQLAPNDVELLNNLGSALAMKGELNEAVQTFRAAVRLAPEQPDSHYNLATALLAQQQREEAIREYREVLRLRADYPKVREQLRTLGVSE